jgi:hypothetical protein
MIAANEAAGLVWIDAIWRRGLAAEPQTLVSAWADRHILIVHQIMILLIFYVFFINVVWRQKKRIF